MAHAAAADFASLLRRHRRERQLTQEELAERAGLSVGAVSTLERGVAQSPHRDTVQLLIQALALSNEDAAALLQAARAARSPTAQGAEAATHLLGGASLPEPLTSLIGRESELAAIRSLLAQERVRLLTLTGPAGVGKTRLAIQVASTLREEHTGEVAFVNLTSIQEPDRVLPTIAQALDVRAADALPPRDALVAALTQRRMLLVLDNFEQVLPAARALADLLGACPRVKGLVTSRAALNIRGEQEFAVPPLEALDPRRVSLDELERSPAVALFLERARAVQPTFALDTAEQRRWIAEICVHLDGLPLAIELAAARVRHFSLFDLHERLTGQTPLSALAGGARDLADHQQTMRSAIAWSYALLSPEEQHVFCLLSVFPGGATMAGLAAISGVDADPLTNQLSTLVDQSLAQAVQRDSTTRYTLLVTLRAFGLEKLAASGELEAARGRCAEYLVSLAEALEERLIRCEPEALLELAAEHDNVRSALRWTLEPANASRLLLGLRLAAAVWNFWEIRGFLMEGLGYLEWLIAQVPAAETPKMRLALAKVWTGVMVLSYRLNRNERAYQAGEASLALRRELGDAKETALALNNLGNVALVLGQYEVSEALYQESLALNDTINYPLGKVKPLLNLGKLKRQQRFFAEALAFYRESLALGELTGEDDQGRAILWNNIGDAYICLNDPAQALPALRQGLALFEKLDSTWGVAMSAYDLGRCAYARHEWDEAARQLIFAVDVRDELGDVAGAAQARVTLARVRLGLRDPEGAAHALRAAFLEYVNAKQPDALWSVMEGAAALACAHNHTETALQLYTVAIAKRDAVLDVVDPPEYEWRWRDLATLRTTLGDETFAALSLTSEALAPEELLRLMLSEVE